MRPLRTKKRVTFRIGAFPAALVCGALLTCFPCPEKAYADGDARRSLTRWARECSSREGFSLRVRKRPAGHLIVEAGLRGSEPLLVDITRASPEAFVEVGGLGLSPIANYASWSDAPAHERKAFEKLAACVETAPPEVPAPDPAGSPVQKTEGMKRTAGKQAPAPGRPWLLLAGLLLAGGLAFSTLRGKRTAELARMTYLSVGLFAGTFIFRRLAVEPAYFHQNGHGPQWLRYALGEPSTYGPGFQEMFRLVAELSPGEPESKVFFAQALLSATGPVCVLVICRAAGLAGPLAAAFAFGLAIDPLWARISFSESYYATTASLTLLAAACLAQGSVRSETHRWRYVAACLAASCLVAQGARVHPLCWIPMSALPLTALVVAGSFRERLTRTISGAFIIGCSACATVLPVMIDVLTGPRGEWAHRFSFHPLAALLLCCAAVPFAIGLVLLRKEDELRGSRLLSLGTVGACLALMAANELVAAQIDWIRHAYWRLALSPLIGPLAALLATVPVRRKAAPAAVVVASAAVAFSLITWRPLTELPTDALEAGLVTRWRSRIPDGSRIVYLGQIDSRVVSLPFFGPYLNEYGIDWPREREKLPPIDDFYVHSSLCSTREGKEVCEMLERNSDLNPVLQADLPARPSMPKMDYLGRTVRIGLYRAGR